MENSELEDFFFGRLTVKIFKCSHKYFTSAITEKKVSALNLFAASIYLGLGKLLSDKFTLICTSRKDGPLWAKKDLRV